MSYLKRVLNSKYFLFLLINTVSFIFSLVDYVLIFTHQLPFPIFTLLGTYFGSVVGLLYVVVNLIIPKLNPNGRVGFKDLILCIISCVFPFLAFPGSLVGLIFGGVGLWIFSIFTGGL